MGEKFIQGYGIIIGVGADLPTTVVDAKGISGILTDPERCAYPNNQVIELTGKTANRSNILTVLDQLAKKTTSESTVIIYFSGHGFKLSTSFGQLYYLIPNGYDISRLNETAISDVEFAQKLSNIPAEKLLVILDCCHAGGVGRAKGSDIDFIKSSFPPQTIDLLGQGRGNILIASSKEDEFSYVGKPYSEFTLALIEAFSGVGVAKKDGYVRVADLALHTRQVVPVRTKDKQHPIFDFEHADNYVVSYYAGGDTEPKNLPFSKEATVELDSEINYGQNFSTEIEGIIQGTLLTGNFNDHGQTTEIKVEGGFYQPDWKVGHVTQVQGNYSESNDITVGDITGSTGIAIGTNAHVSVDNHSGMSRNEIHKLFDELRSTLMSSFDSPITEEVNEALTNLKSEAENGDQAEETRITKWLTFLADIAPDVWEVVVKTLVNPTNGLSVAFRKIVQKSKEQRS